MLLRWSPRCRQQQREYSYVTTRRYFPFWKCPKLALTSAHGAAVGTDLAGVAVLDVFFCMFLNQTFSRRRAMVFTRPWCPACAILAVLICSASGSTIQCPLRMMLSLYASDSSARLACRVWNVALFMPSSTPCHLLVRMAWMMVVSVLSFAVSVATSSIVIALGVEVERM